MLAVSHGVDPARACEILAGAQGERRASGYRVAPGVVITVAHAVSEVAPLQVRFNARRSNEWTVDARVAFISTDPQVDLAVLEIDPAVPGEHLEPVRFGRIPDGDVELPVSALGFPRAKLRPGRGYRDSFHLRGTAPVLSNRKEGTLHIDARPPERDPEANRSPWEGMSGAAVFSSGCVIGLIQEHHGRDGLGGLAAVRVNRWYEALAPADLRLVCALLELPAAIEGLPLVASDDRRIALGEAPGAVPGTVSARRRAGICVAPALPSRLVDRPEQRDSAVAALLGGAHLGFVGMPGTGKSVLARTVVADPRVADRFGERVAWLDIGPEPDLVGRQTRLAAAFGDSRPIADVPAGRDQLRELLRGAACLIVLDDVWEVESLAAFDLGLDEVVLLLTTRSRDALYPETTALAVDRVSPAEAREVLARYSGQPVDTLPPEAAQVAAACGYLMLALAIAASMVAEGRRWPSLLERLRRAQFGKLAVRLRDYPYPNLLAAIETGVADLSEPEQARLHELAVFHGRGAILEAAAAQLWGLAGLDELDTEDLLVRLSRRSLLVRDAQHGAFSLHDIIFEYVRSQHEPDDLAALHARLANSYLDRWGGLDAGLPGLRVPAVEVRDEYGIRQLVEHLAAAGQDELIHRLLRLEWPHSVGDADNAWYAVHERLGLVADYYGDVRAAWRRAIEAGVDGNRPDAAGPALEVRYALILGSLTSIASNLPIELVAGLVEAKMWSPPQALANVQAIPWEDSRAQGLMLLAPQFSDDLVEQVRTAGRGLTGPRQRARVLGALASRSPDEEVEDRYAEAAASVSAVEDPAERCEACMEIAPLLPEHLRARLAEMGVDAARRAADDLDVRVARMIVLAPHLAERERLELVEEAWEATRAVTDPYWQARALGELFPLLPPHLKANALELATGNAEPAGRAHALSTIAPHLPEHDRDRAARLCLDAIGATRDDPYLQASALSALAAQLSETDLPRARAVAARIIDRGARAQALLGLVSRLPKEQRAALVAQALGSARAVTGNALARAEAFAAVAAQLDGEQSTEAWREALTAAGGMADLQGQIRLLTELVADLPDALESEALRVARALTEPYAQAHVLTAIAARQSALSHEYLLEALSAIRSVHCDPWAPAVALIALGAHLPDDERAPLVSEALARIRGIGNANMQAHGLQTAANLIPPPLWWEAFAIASTINDSILQGNTQVALLTSIAERPTGDVIVALRALERLSPKPPTETIAALLANLTEDSLHAVSETVSEPQEVVQLITETVEQRARDYALMMVNIGNSQYDENAVWWLAQQLDDPDEDRARDALETLVALLEQIDDLDLFASVVDLIAARLDPDTAIRILEGTGRFEPVFRIRVFGPISHALPTLTRDEFVTSYLAGSSGFDTALYLARLVDVAVALEDTAAMEVALDVVEEVDDPAKRVEALLRLIPVLPPALHDRVLTLTGAIRAPEQRADVLWKLAPALQAQSLPDALRLAEEIGDADQRAFAVRTVALAAGHFAPARWDGYWRTALEGCAAAGRQLTIEAVIDAAPVLSAIGGHETVRAVRSAVSDIERWWPAERNAYRWLPDAEPDEFAADPGRPDVPITDGRLLVPGMIASEPATEWDRRATIAVSRFTERLLSSYPSRRRIPAVNRIETLPAQFMAAATETVQHFARTASDKWYAGRWVEAVDEITAYLRFYPNDAERLSYRGQILSDLGYAALALKDLQKAISLDLPQLAYAYAVSAQAYALGTLGRLDEAYAEFDKSLMLTPHNAWTFFRRGLLRYATGDLETAKQDLDEAVLATDPPLTDLQYEKAVWALLHAFPAE